MPTLEQQLNSLKQEHGYTGYLTLWFDEDGVEFIGKVPWGSVALLLLKYAPALARYAPNIVDLISKSKANANQPRN